MTQSKTSNDKGGDGRHIPLGIFDAKDQIIISTGPGQAVAIPLSDLDVSTEIEEDGDVVAVPQVGGAERYRFTVPVATPDALFSNGEITPAADGNNTKLVLTENMNDQVDLGCLTDIYWRQRALNQNGRIDFSIYGLSDNSEDADVTALIGAGSALTVGNSAGFEFVYVAGERTINTVTSNETTETRTDVTEALAEVDFGNDANLLTVQVVSESGDVEFYVNGELISTHTTNTPVNSWGGQSGGFSIRRQDTNAGTLEVYVSSVELSMDAA